MTKCLQRSDQSEHGHLVIHILFFSYLNKHFFKLKFSKLLLIVAPRIIRLHGQALPYREIKLFWDDPKPTNGILKPYEVNCHEIGGNATLHAQTTERLVIFKNLLLKTWYKCTLKASTYPEKEQNPKECEVVVESPRMRTFDISESGRYN